MKEKGRYNYDVTATNIRAGVISIAVIQPVYGTLLFLRLCVARVWTTKGGTYSIYIYWHLDIRVRSLETPLVVEQQFTQSYIPYVPY